MDVHNVQDAENNSTVTMVSERLLVQAYSDLIFFFYTG